jgi:FkbM family methyltransferase
LLHRAGINAVQTYVDVGCNRGQTIEEIRYIWPSAKVIAFDILCDCVQDVRRKWPDVDARCIGLGASETRETILRGTYEQTSSFLRCTQESRELYHLPFEQYDAGSIPVSTLDKQLDAVDRIDLLKIDVQGYELEVFAGAEQTLLRTGAIIVECNCIPCYEGGSTISTVISALARRGFRLKYLFDTYRDEDTTIVNHVDGLFLPEV